MDLALNNLQRLICHKPKQTNKRKLIQIYNRHDFLTYRKNNYRSIDMPLKSIILSPEIDLSIEEISLTEAEVPQLSYLPTPPLGQDMTQGQF